MDRRPIRCDLDISVNMSRSSEVLSDAIQSAVTHSPVNQSFHGPALISRVDTSCADMKSFGFVYTSIALWLCGAARQRTSVHRNLVLCTVPAPPTQARWSCVKHH